MIFDHYQIQVATDALFTSIVIEEDVSGILNSSFTPAADLAANMTYYWRVRAFSTGGDYSGWSTVRYFRTALLPPELVAPAEGSTAASLKPTFEWGDVSGASSYSIQISRNSRFSSTLLSKKVTSSTYTATKALPAGKRFYWRVRANGVNGPSLWSTTGSFMTP